MTNNDQKAGLARACFSRQMARSAVHEVLSQLREPFDETIGLSIPVVSMRQSQDRGSDTMQFGIDAVHFESFAQLSQSREWFLLRRTPVKLRRLCRFLIPHDLSPTRADLLSSICNYPNLVYWSKCRLSLPLVVKMVHYSRDGKDRMSSKNERREHPGHFTGLPFAGGGTEVSLVCHWKSRRRCSYCSRRTQCVQCSHCVQCTQCRWVGARATTQRRRR